MLERIVGKQIRWLAILIAIGVFLPQSANADALADYLFMQQMQEISGKAAEGFEQYTAERQLWRDKIAAAKDQAAKCGNCPAAMDELHKWQKIENQFQDVAGSLGASVGMPPEIADFLGIDLPIVPGRSMADRIKECEPHEPEWASGLRGECPKIVQDYFTCLGDYQSRNGYCTWKDAYAFGNACSDQRKLYQACANEDYDGLAREQAAQRFRAENPTVPEYNDDDMKQIVYYPHPPDDFAPEFPPPATVNKIIEQKKGHFLGILYIMNKSLGGPLQRIALNYFWVANYDPDLCAKTEDPSDEIDHRICDDMNETMRRYHPLMLTCVYSRNGESQKYSEYWYSERPASAAPKRLIAHAGRNHPLLRIQDARTDCPADYDEAQSIEDDYWNKLAELNIKEVSAGVELRSKWLQQQLAKMKGASDAAAVKELKAFPLVGSYEFDVDSPNANPYGRPLEGECTIEDAGEGKYNLDCTNGGRAFSAAAAMTGEGLLVKWTPDFQVLYRVSANLDKALRGYLHGNNTDQSYGETLVRTASYSQEDFKKMMSLFDFKGSYDLEVKSNGQSAKFRCQVSIDRSYTPHRFPTVCHGPNGKDYEDEGAPKYGYTEGLDMKRKQVIRYRSYFYEVGNVRAPVLSVGDVKIRDLIFPLQLPVSEKEPVNQLQGYGEHGLTVKFSRVDGG